MLGERTVEVDATAEADEGPLRTCIVTRARLEPDRLIRFVVAPDGGIVPDLAHRLPGRGSWVTATRGAVEAAVTGKSFARGFKRQVSVPVDLAERIEALMARRLAEAVSLANKAGQLVAGFAKIDKALAAGEVIALLHGSDASADGCQKLDAKLQAVARSRGVEAWIIDLLTIDELSLAIGRGNVVHAALRDGGAARRVSKEAERLRRYRSGDVTSEGQSGRSGS